MRRIFPGFSVGLLFGAGLALSGMINPARVSSASLMSPALGTQHSPSCSPRRSFPPRSPTLLCAG